MEWQNEASFVCTFCFYALSCSFFSWPLQAAALVTLVALKLTLKSGFGCGFAVTLSDSTASMEFTEKGAVCLGIF